MASIETLKFWLAGTQNSGLRLLAERWWQRVENWLRWPLAQLAAQTCTQGVLDLLVWQREIRRFKGEPLNLYRKRVAFAAANAIDAGSSAGFVWIFERLGLGSVVVRECNAGLDWDIVLLEMSDSHVARNTELLGFVVQQTVQALQAQLNALPIQKSATTAAQVYKGYGIYTDTNDVYKQYSFQHTLGVIPKQVFFWLTCRTATHGYAVGQRVHLQLHQTNTAGSPSIPSCSMPTMSISPSTKITACSYTAGTTEAQTGCKTITGTCFSVCSLELAARPTDAARPPAHDRRYRDSRHQRH